jgi:hypothetical protein
MLWLLQAALVITDIDSPTVPAAEPPPAEASPHSERDLASPPSERLNPLLDSPVVSRQPICQQHLAAVCQACKHCTWHHRLTARLAAEYTSLVLRIFTVPQALTLAKLCVAGSSAEPRSRADGGAAGRRPA